ncbi:hypothetical protein PV04_08554 [Phialophora macrospora]|uniref:Uncharacterized protein n=1 Tax=Phialophora macrospora TaxID=1851006 RepID=A0A0D2F6L2_9EURO|nr:hypothetical protein PV04_08554 [Phialophora macrospora]
MPIKLHAQYGPIVRIRPNTVIIDDPQHFGELFNWPKSDFFLSGRGDPHVVSHGAELDLHLHKIKKRRIMGGFTMSQVLKNESCLDRRVMEFLDQLAKKCDTIFDMAPWTQFATFDIAMDMIFSNPVGFLKAGRDVDNIIATLHSTFTFFGVAGLQPWIARIMYHPWIFPLIGPKPTDKRGPGAFLGFTQKQVASRLDKAMDAARPDILQWILDHADKDSQHTMTKPMLEQESMGVALAASDSTAGTLRAIVLAVASNARILTKLRREIDAADAQGALSTPPTYDQIKQHIPYLEVVFKEAQRTYPIVGLPLFRTVPKSGAHIAGHFFPAGTEVGVSQWAVGHNPRVYGEDVALFRPERWSEDLCHDPDARRRRDQAEIWFSRGPMMCTGRNIAMVEVYKIVAQFFRFFDVEVVNTTSPWTVKALLVIVHSNFLVKLTKREGKAEAEVRKDHGQDQI